MWGLWFGLIFCSFWHLCIAQTLRPQIANHKLATNNPTLTTVALEKPFCVFDGLMLKGTSYEVYLYTMVDSGTSRPSVTDNRSKPLNATFQQTNGGQSGPYKAAVFHAPNCASPPKLSDAADATKASAVMTQYLIRVGDDAACLYDPNFLEACNSPLSQDTVYRFKYLLVDRTAGVMKGQTLWSHPIKTRRVKQSSTIDTWPGRRSGGMIVITSILSVLMFIVVVGFVAAILLAVTPSEETPTEMRYESQTTQLAVPRVLEMSESHLIASPIH
ncbi:uroplakin-3a isoform X2 [Rhineura floridana]|uniref:uroplakin-3a isoform X2 n=1 Tax=Rhineura floridana TaxID=261503 RepID=UPI002AC85970|nr:uroplakin-3a isoform X2 [Rhineura floridana]